MPNVIFFFFNDTATTEIYTLSLHDALPISTPASETATQVDEPVPADGTVADEAATRSEEHTSELQSQSNLVCRLLLEKKKKLELHTIFRFSGSSFVPLRKVCSGFKRTV